MIEANPPRTAEGGEGSIARLPQGSWLRFLEPERRIDRNGNAAHQRRHEGLERQRQGGGEPPADVRPSSSDRTQRVCPDNGESLAW